MLQEYEKKCPIREKESLAIKWSCEVFRPYIQGTEFQVITDHQSLEWLMRAKEPAQIIRWALVLSEFNLTIKYRRGNLNNNSDALSRLANPDASTEAECRFEQVLTIAENRIIHIEYQSDEIFTQSTK